ncbi:BCD family MFS transporter [Romeria aff. gracilis LEGE 07310]|uniref:BCD family MFS transporter n=2 Tax=Vasconcelosia TaxID=3366328 RepID=A0A8J7DME0_9CYAN|nr:BCD family MFS transporter [Romeria aff. gracilis LEGE 07310]
MLRLGMFNMGLGIMSLLTLGVLNRVMIDELRVPALVAAGAIAVHQFMAPARVWFGQLSDTRPLLGHHRSGYIWLGIISMAVTAFLSVQVVWRLAASIAETGWQWSLTNIFWVGLLALMFALYGLALSSTSTPYTALLVDVSDEQTQSRLVGIGWSMLMVGIIAGVIITVKVLDSLSDVPTLAQIQSSINRLFIIAPAIVCGLAIFSTVGIEKKYSHLEQRSRAANREDQITLGRALRILTASRQTGLFFCFLLVLSLSLFMQDAVLEPYGGQIFGMKIAETTQLNAYFGLGTLLGIIAAGFLLVPRLGKKRTVKLGCSAAAGCLVLLTLTGLTAQPPLLMGSVGLFGLAAGVLTTGSIVLMLDLTAAETAGTFIGAWGLAQAMARGGATLLGGGLLTLGKRGMALVTVGPIPEEQQLPAYALVFLTQAVGMIIAIALLSRVNIREFQLNAKAAITAALESDLD